MFALVLYLFIVITVCAYCYLYTQNYYSFDDFGDHVYHLKTMLESKKKVKTCFVDLQQSSDG